MPDWIKDKASLKEFLIRETIEVWIVIAYLAVCFVIMATSKGLILQQYGINYLGYGYVVALFGAMTLGKVVVLFERSSIANRYSHKPLILAVLYKTILTTVVVDVYNMLEHLVFELWNGHQPAELLLRLSGAGIAAHQMALLLIFGLFFSLREISRLLGKGMLYKVFFRSPTIAPEERKPG
ncbi:MAG: hypothetical protein V2J55_14015 [Candidatus Competibacteraceae bacterium]|nr:hypothetical protein [Candidatus Competibacteraceae bacterium]